MRILEQIYPAEQIFVSNPRFHELEPKVTVTCRVPWSPPGAYTIQPVRYVTTENYVRILSQTAYLLAEHILAAKMVPIEISVEQFRKATEELQHLYYRNLSMTFHKRVDKDQSFEMELVLTDFREIKRLHDFILFTFSNTRTVISGEMSFVYVA